jgi:hypothetical protein
MAMAQAIQAERFIRMAGATDTGVPSRSSFNPRHGNRIAVPLIPSQWNNRT